MLALVQTATIADESWFAIFTGIGGFALGALSVGLTWRYQRINTRRERAEHQTRLEMGTVEGSVDGVFWYVRIELRNRSRHVVELVSAAIDTAPQRQGDLRFVRLAHSTAGWGPVWEDEAPRAELAPGARVWATGKVGRLALTDDETALLNVVASTGDTFSWPISLQPGTRDHWP